MFVKEDTIPLLIISNVATLALLVVCVVLLSIPSPDVRSVYEAGKKYARSTCEKERATNCDLLVLDSIDYGDEWIMTFYTIDKQDKTRWIISVVVDDSLRELYSTSDKAQCRIINGTNCLL